MRITEITRRVLPALGGNAARMGAGFLVSKYVALIYGPGGMALLGQFVNFNGLLMNLSTGAIENGVVRHVAETQASHPPRMQRAISISFQIVTVLSILVATVVALAARPLAGQIFFSADYAGVVVVLGVAMLALGPLNWLMAAINGVGRLNGLALLNALMALGSIGAVAVAFSRPHFSLGLFLMLLTVANLPALVVACWLGARWLPRPDAPWRTRGTGADYASFLRYSAMSGTAAVVVPVTAMIVRQIVIAQSGLAGAGLVEALNRLSGSYLGLFTTTFAMYYLPRLSAAREPSAQIAEVRAMMAVVLPLVLLLGTLVLVFKDALLRLLFSAEFSLPTGLVALQLAGDVLRMASWLLAYQMIARGMAAAFVFWELAAAATRIGFTYALAPRWGLHGAVASYALCYVVYGAGMLWLFRHQFGRKA